MISAAAQSQRFLNIPWRKWTLTSQPHRVWGTNTDLGVFVNALKSSLISTININTLKYYNKFKPEQADNVNG